jgi:hypothetical protein
MSKRFICSLKIPGAGGMVTSFTITVEVDKEEQPEEKARKEILASNSDWQKRKLREEGATLVCEAVEG